jgi:tRNA(Ile2) C34 agmatinyltransferase TiaS
MMIYVGIDDTDMPDTPGTNQLARALIVHVSDRYRCRMVLRHQLLDDPRVPYTSKNGSASLQFEPRDPGAWNLVELIDRLRTRMREWYIPGSDPGLCVATVVPPEITAFGERCQRELVTRDDAVKLAAANDIHLEGLGGTHGGMIGALAAIGLAVAENDGRVVVLGEYPDDLSGWQSLETLIARGVEVRRLDSDECLTAGKVDVGKHLRPNLRRGRVIQFVRPADVATADAWQAVRLT